MPRSRSWIVAAAIGVCCSGLATLSCSQHQPDTPEVHAPEAQTSAPLKVVAPTALHTVTNIKNAFTLGANAKATIVKRVAKTQPVKRRKHVTLSKALRQATITAIQKRNGDQYKIASDRSGGFTAMAGLQSSFSREGRLSITVGNQLVETRLEGIGRRGQLTPAPQIDDRFAQRNRLNYRRTGALKINEWYLNGRLGIEQGFDIETRLSGEGPLELALNVSGTVTPQLQKDRIVFRGSNNNTVMSYQDAFAFDANKQALPIKLSVVGKSIMLSVDDSKATYPITIDPLYSTEQKLLASTPAASELFGTCVDVLGGRAVVGAPGVAGGGAVFAFERSGGTWTEIQEVVPTGGGFVPVTFGGGCTFGASNAHLLVGDPGAGALASFFDAGAGYTEVQTAAGGANNDVRVLRFDNNTIILNLKNGVSFATGDYNPADGTLSFGYALPAVPGADTAGEGVALSGTTAVVGVPTDNSSTGAVYVFTGATVGGWTHQATLTASDGQAGDQFGAMVAVDEATGTLLVGAPAVGSGRPGAVYNFTGSVATWTEGTKINGFANDDEFGALIRMYALTGPSVRAFIGAPGADSGQGKFYVANGTAGVTLAADPEVSPLDLANGDRFGTDVAADLAASPQLVVSGAPGFSSSQGAAYAMTDAAPQGTACTASDQCLSGNCIDGFCCNTACGNGANDCQACNVAGSEGTCSPANSGMECRAAVPGGCDVAESCDGSSLTCPTDAVQPSGTECRAAVAGGCDVAETCDGTANTCPADAVEPSGTVCRSAVSGGCDIEETCDGTANTCPADVVQPSGTECRAAVPGGCDVAEACDGTANTCPADAVQPSGTVCRTAVAGGCDVEEACDGTANTCPADAVEPSGTECRAAVPGGCDVAENCDGTANTCPADVVQPSGTECRAAVPGGCDVAENCDGTANTCPADVVQPSGTECRAAVPGGCDVAENCDGTANSCPADVVQPAGTECRAAVAGGCDVAENCDGTANTCPADAVEPAGTECRAAAGDCDVAENCDGTANSCPADVIATAGTECRAAVAGGCDIAETCDGTATDCPADVVATAGTECRAAAGDCDVAENCDGTANTCPVDALATPGTECRASAGECDVAENCDGTAADCPTDVFAPDGQTCTGGQCNTGQCIPAGQDAGIPGSDGGAPGTDGGAPGTDGGVQPGTDGGVGGDGGGGGGGGCDCSTTPKAPTDLSWFALLLLGLVRRRKR